jgi:hypothetical protein
VVLVWHPRLFKTAHAYCSAKTGYSAQVEAAGSKLKSGFFAINEDDGAYQMPDGILGGYRIEF